ncbi:hypothetical protein B296_00015013 [Ensete ventricosum]|uniref:Uncharacterized protein n=1 Tax=Ensete ventricosum TaxID=4639 RepID=A0A426YNF9_ENSVE|nr:hypothetical protein B296_00015013 [Ensete ventricosum]
MSLDLLLVNSLAPSWPAPDILGELPMHSNQHRRYHHRQSIEKLGDDGTTITWVVPSSLDWYHHRMGDTTITHRRYYHRVAQE